MLSLLFSSLALLALVAIFRWKAHDEKIDLYIKIYAEYVVNNYDRKDVFDGEIPRGLEDLETIKTMLRTMRKRSQEKLDELNKIEPETRDQFQDFFMQDFINDGSKMRLATISNLEGQTHIIRKFFNRPFFFTLFTITTYLVFEYTQIKPEFHSIPFIILSCLALGFCLLRFYNLFNFDYNPNPTHGFNCAPWLYNVFFKPRL